MSARDNPAPSQDPYFDTDYVAAIRDEEMKYRRELDEVQQLQKINSAYVQQIANIVQHERDIDARFRQLEAQCFKKQVQLYYVLSPLLVARAQVARQLNDAIDQL